MRTPLLGPFEKTLRAAGSAIIEPSEVADAIVGQILKCAGGQVFLPASVARVSSLRGLPNWVQEVIRAGVGKTIAPAIKGKEGL